MTDSEHEDVEGEVTPPVDLIGPRPGLRMVLYCLAVIAVLYVLHAARSLLMPFVVALFFALLLSPLVSWFKLHRVPRTISSVLLIGLLGVPFVFLSLELAEPAQKWMGMVPELTLQVTEELTDISESLSPAEESPSAVAPAPKPARGFSFSRFFRGDDGKPVELEAAPPEEPEESALVEGVKESSVDIILSMLGVAPYIVWQWVIWLILVLFLLIYGPGLYDNFINLVPHIRDKRRAVLLVGRARQELSRYIMTVTIINAALGFVTGAVLWALGVEDAMLWGALAGLLNYAPYVGPIVAMCILGIAGIAQYDLTVAALLPVGVFFSLHLLESNFLTPAVLGQHMHLNPLILVLWLLIWGWIWGPVGALIAVPLLVCLKLVATQLEIMNYWVELVETKA